MFDGIVRAIKGMDDEMPLALVQASPVSEMLRYTFLVCYPSSSDVCGSLSRPNAQYMPTMEMILGGLTTSRQYKR